MNNFVRSVYTNIQNNIHRIPDRYKTSYILSCHFTKHHVKKIRMESFRMRPELCKCSPFCEEVIALFLLTLNYISRSVHAKEHVHVSPKIKIPSQRSQKNLNRKQTTGDLGVINVEHPSIFNKRYAMIRRMTD